jgi:type I restriction enzyme R subunit
VPNSTEAFSRVKIDAQLRDVGWTLDDGISVHFEYTLADGTKADYVLCDRNGHPLAVLEAKRQSTMPTQARGQARQYATLLDVPYVFLSNGDESLFWEWRREAHPHQISTLFSQADLERRAATLKLRRDPLEVPIDKRVAGRDYQMACIDNLCREMSLGRRKLLVEMATGTGKTRTAAALIKRLFEANQLTRVLFLVDRIALAKQTEDAFAEHLPDLPCYVLRAGRRVQHEKRVTITTLQTMINEYAAFSSGYFDLVITDECHRSIYGQWSGVLKHFDGVQLGLTATPCVLKDADTLPDPEDGAFVKDTLRFFEVDKPTYRYPLKQAIAEGTLVPYRIYKALTVKTAAEGGFTVRRDELDWSAMDEATRAELEKAFACCDPITVDPSALERRFTIPERNRAIVREFREVLEKGFTGKDGVRRAPQWGKTIVFAVTKKHAETLALMFDREFADKKPSPDVRYADFVVCDTGDGATPDASTIIKRFKKEDFPRIVVSVNMLDTGFDCPEVVNLVMARFTRSAILYQQMRGRGSRKAPHIKKTGCTLFDFVGVGEFHGDDDEYGGGGVIHETKPKKKYETRRLLTLDVHDMIDPATREWLTLDDDGSIVYSEAHEARANDLGLRFEAWLATREFNADQLRWVRLMESKIKADAEALTGFEDYLFDDPPFSLNGGYMRAVQLFGGESGLTTMLASLNAMVFEGGHGASAARPQPMAH